MDRAIPSRRGAPISFSDALPATAAIAIAPDCAEPRGTWIPRQP
jgi:hypothetical protein